MVIPPELVDRIIDHLHGDTKALITCSLTARDWVPSTRLHLFRKLSLLSADEVTKFAKLDRSVPVVLYYCQELSIGTKDRLDRPSIWDTGTPPAVVGERIESFTSLRMLHFRELPSGMKGILTPFLNISEKITTTTITNSSLESCHDLWKILRLFPNLANVHVSNLGYSSSEQGRLVFAPGHCHSPPITSFSLHTYCQGFVLEQLAEPPYPLTYLTSLEIHHTDQQQHHLSSIAIKYQDAITTLKFSASSTLGSGTRSCLPSPLDDSDQIS